MTPRIISEPGIYDLPEDAYHADPCIEPSLSNSIAHVLLEQSPLHAWTRHPRLNPAHEPEDASARMNVGKAVHAMVLGKGASVVEVKADSFRTNEAKEARDEAIAAGCIPLLSDDLARVSLIVEAARDQVAAHSDLSRINAFDQRHGRPEQAIFWREQLGTSQFWCRGLIDWLPHDARLPIIDLKTTAISANPDTFARQIFNMGYATQAAMYTRGLRIIQGSARRDMIFVVIETEEPFALVAIDLSPMALALADQEIDRAFMKWQRCLSTGLWPGYAPRIHTAEAPGWLEAKLVERRDRDNHADAALLQRAFEAQRPLESTR